MFLQKMVINKYTCVYLYLFTSVLLSSAKDYTSIYLSDFSVLEINSDNDASKGDMSVALVFRSESKNCENIWSTPKVTSSLQTVKSKHSLR